MLVDLSRIRGEVHDVQISILSEHRAQLEEQGVHTSLISTKRSAVQAAIQELLSSFTSVEGFPEESNSAQESQEVELVQVWHGKTQLTH